MFVILALRYCTLLLILSPVFFFFFFERVSIVCFISFDIFRFILQFAHAPCYSILLYSLTLFFSLSILFLPCYILALHYFTALYFALCFAFLILFSSLVYFVRALYLSTSLRSLYGLFYPTLLYFHSTIFPFALHCFVSLHYLASIYFISPCFPYFSWSSFRSGFNLISSWGHRASFHSLLNLLR